jgi:hypothetical protein
MHVAQLQSVLYGSVKKSSFRYWQPLQRFLWSHITTYVAMSASGGLPISGSENGGQYRSFIRHIHVAASEPKWPVAVQFPVTGPCT